MNFRKITAAALSAAVLASIAVMPSVTAEDKLAAFPGAEGGGMWASGARYAQCEVYHVTSLADSGKGTLRDAVSKSNRVIVFDVAGNIELKNALSITGDNLTILGQTAPGDGICIKDNTVAVFGDNVILRYLRFRMGDAATVEDDTLGGRGLNNVIIDHCSMSWSTDECVSFYENTNFTMQWCIISESLKKSVHAKGSHGYAGIWGGQNASFHHNLIAHHDSRNPRIATAGIDAAYNDVTQQTDLTDLRNNVVYNWGGNSAYGGENGAPVNVVSCYYKPGPSTGSHKARLYQISAKNEGDNSGTNSLNRPGWGTDVYVSGNYVEGSSTVTNDNAAGVDIDTNVVKFGKWTDDTITNDEKIVHERYANEYPINTQPAQDAYTAVLDSAGASMVRDSVDTRIINDVKNGTGAIINSQSEVGGYPELTGTKAKDSDNDGMPNEWEDAHGLNKFSADDALNKASSGYLNIEEYANALADGTYVRNTAYDPDVPDYSGSEDPSETPKPTAAPQKELVSEWIAAAGNLNQPAGTEFMPGLSGMISFGREMKNVVNYEDGSSYGYAISDKDANGGWNASAGEAKGTAMKFTAPCDGVFTIYGYTVSGTKTFYVMPQGAKDVSECVYSEQITGSAVPVCYTQDMKKGETYYFYIDGSKMRYCGAKYEKYAEVQATPEPTATPEPEKTYTADGIAITTEYDANGALKSVSTAEVKAGDKVIKADAAKKVFVWSSLTGMEPVEIR